MESLTLEQAYYIGELVGVFIVVVSLIYVGQQLSQNNRSQRMAAIQSHNDTYHKTLSLVAEHTETWIVGLNDYSNLEAPKQVEFGMLIQCVVRHAEQSWLMMTEGVLKRGAYLSAASLASGVMSYPGSIAWWSSRREYFDGEFVQSFETIIKQNETKDLYKIRQKE